MKNLLNKLTAFGRYNAALVGIWLISTAIGTTLVVSSLAHFGLSIGLLTGGFFLVCTATATPKYLKTIKRNLKFDKKHKLLVKEMDEITEQIEQIIQPAREALSLANTNQKVSPLNVYLTRQQNKDVDALFKKHKEKYQEMEVNRKSDSSQLDDKALNF